MAHVSSTKTRQRFREIESCSKCTHCCVFLTFKIWHELSNALEHFVLLRDNLRCGFDSLYGENNTVVLRHRFACEDRSLDLREEST